MPWKYQASRLLILKQLVAGQTGKTGINSAICYRIAPNWTSGIKGLVRGGSALTSIESRSCHSEVSVPEWKGVFIQEVR